MIPPWHVPSLPVVSPQPPVAPSVPHLLSLPLLAEPFPSKGTSRRAAGAASRERSARHALESSHRTGPSRRPAVTMGTGPVLLTQLAVSPRMERPLTTYAVWCTRVGARGHLRRSRTQRSVAPCSTPVVGRPIIRGRGHAIHVRDEEEPIVRPYQTTPTGTRARHGTARVVRRHDARH